MNHVWRFANLAALGFLVVGCTYGYAPPYNPYGTGPEVTVSTTPSQGVR
jgi:hypothetical protein